MEEVQGIGGSLAGSGGGCFRKGTIVQLEHGKTIAIENLSVGDEILAFDETGAIHLARVTAVHFHSDPQPILRVKFWNGEVFITPNHWVLNQYGNFAEIGRLTKHDALVDGMGHLRPIIGAEYVCHEPVWNLTVEPHHTFVANGIRVHNGGHRDRYPTIAGAGGGGGGKGGGGSRAAIEDDDSLQSRAMVSIIDLIGEGQIGGLVDGAKSIYFDETPLMNDDGTTNFSGVTWDFRDGRQDQTPMVGYADIESPTAVSVKVTKSISKTITITNPNIDSVRLVVTVPQLVSTDTSTGDIHGSSVTFKFEVSMNGGAYQYLSGDLTITGKTRSKYQRSYQYALPKYAIGGGAATTWNIKMTRITDDSATSAVSNEVWFDSYSEIVDSKLTYPNSSIIGVKIDSSQFSSIPKRAYLINGLYIKIPSNYDPAVRTYSGVWDGTFKVAVSNNPAWVLYDILTSERYGLGQYLSSSDIDKAKLYQLGKYCDELVPNGFGGMEPRFTINTAIQTQVEAFRLVTDLCSALNGMAFWASGVKFTQDSPTDPSMVFSQANVIDGMFEYSGSSRKDRHSVVQVAWNDPTQNYKQMIEYVEDPDLIAKYGVRKFDTVAFGCTSRGQAARVGKWILYTEQYQSDIVQFKVGIDAALVVPGDVIKIQDASKAGKRMGGRLVAATTTELTLDAPVSLNVNGLSVISIRMPDGTFVDRNIVQSGSTTPLKTINVTPALPSVPLSNAIWLIANTDLQPMLARVIGVGQGENPGEFQITALEHNASKYDAIEKGLKLIVPKTSVIDASATSQPKNPIVEEAPAVVAPGIMGLDLHASWEGQAASYEVTWRRDGRYQTNWVTVIVKNAGIDLSNVRSGTYYFKVVGIGLFGQRSPITEFNHVTIGKTAAPGDVNNFKIENRTSDLLLTWDAVTDIALRGYEIRCGASWEDSQIVTTGFSGTMITHDQDFAGVYNYHIRSIAIDGTLSDNVTTTTLVLEAPSAVTGFSSIQNGERIEFRWDANPEKDIVGYELREGQSWSSSTLVTQLRSTTYSMPTNSISGEKLFWVKAIASPGIYSDDVVFSSTNVAKASDRNAVFLKDEVADGWSGRIKRANVVAGALQSYDRRSEYVWKVNLPQKYRARNSLTFSFDATVYDPEQWKTADFAWNSKNAERKWIAAGDKSGVNLSFYMSKFIADGYLASVTPSTLYYFGFQNNTTANSGSPTYSTVSGPMNYWALTGSNVGLHFGYNTKVNYGINLDAVFGLSFVYRERAWFGSAAGLFANVDFQGEARVYGEDFFHCMTLSGGQSNPANTLTLWMQRFAKADLSYVLCLEDGLGQRISIPLRSGIGSAGMMEDMMIGISQTKTTRSLFVGNRSWYPETVLSAHADYPPLPNAFTNIELGAAILA